MEKRTISTSRSNNNKTRKSPIKNMKERKLGEDEFMAAAIGDVEWLRQSLRGNRGVINYDKNVCFLNVSVAMGDNWFRLSFKCILSLSK